MYENTDKHKSDKMYIMKLNLLFLFFIICLRGLHNVINILNALCP